MAMADSRKLHLQKQTIIFAELRPRVKYLAGGERRLGIRTVPKVQLFIVSVHLDGKPLNQRR